MTSDAAPVSTADMMVRVTERVLYGAVDPRSMFATTVGPYDELALAMARVSTPYWPCSDLPKERDG